MTEATHGVTQLPERRSDVLRLPVADRLRRDQGFDPWPQPVI